MFLIQCEIFLIDNLKINMLFDNNIINIEKLIINIIKKHFIMNNIKILITLNVCSFKIAIQRLIYLRKIIVVFYMLK